MKHGNKNHTAFDVVTPTSRRVDTLPPYHYHDASRQTSGLNKNMTESVVDKFREFCLKLATSCKSTFYRCGGLFFMIFAIN
jgi:hypothetical protein